MVTPGGQCPSAYSLAKTLTCGRSAPLGPGTGHPRAGHRGEPGRGAGALARGILAPGRAGPAPCTGSCVTGRAGGACHRALGGWGAGAPRERERESERRSPAWPGPLCARPLEPHSLKAKTPRAASESEPSPPTRAQPSRAGAKAQGMFRDFGEPGPSSGAGGAYGGPPPPASAAQQVRSRAGQRRSGMGMGMGAHGGPGDPISPRSLRSLRLRVLPRSGPSIPWDGGTEMPLRPGRCPLRSRPCAIGDALGASGHPRAQGLGGPVPGDPRLGRSRRDVPAKEGGRLHPQTPLGHVCLPVCPSVPLSVCLSGPAVCPSICRHRHVPACPFPKPGSACPARMERRDARMYWVGALGPPRLAPPGPARPTWPLRPLAHCRCPFPVEGLRARVRAGREGAPGTPSHGGRVTAADSPRRPSLPGRDSLARGRGEAGEERRGEAAGPGTRVIGPLGFPALAWAGDTEVPRLVKSGLVWMLPGSRSAHTQGSGFRP